MTFSTKNVLINPRRTFTENNLQKHLVPKLLPSFIRGVDSGTGLRKDLKNGTLVELEGLIV